MKVAWTPEAESDLDEIAAFMARFSEAGASRIVDAITVRVRQLEDYPLSGRIVPEYGFTRLRELIEGDYRIVYEVFADRIEIITVANGHRLFPPLQRS